MSAGDIGARLGRGVAEMLARPEEQAWLAGAAAGAYLTREWPFLSSLAVTAAIAEASRRACRLVSGVRGDLALMAEYAGMRLTPEIVPGDGDAGALQPR